MSLLDALSKALKDREATRPLVGPKAPVEPPPSEISRIMALPRRERPRPEDLVAEAASLERRLGLPNTICECVSKYRRRCCNHLLPVQTWALKELEMCQGLLGPIGVGHGKTLLDLLAPMVVPCRVAVLLLPPGLKTQLLKSDWAFYGQHWNLPNLAGSRWHYPGRPVLHVVAFTELSGSKNTDLLERLAPDLLVIDEAHSVSDTTSARSKRLLRFVRNNPSVKVACWSGTLTKRSLLNWAHLSAMSLKQGTPTPRDFPTLQSWAGAVDPSEYPTPAGELNRLCAPGETPFEGFHRRVVETPGVVSSGDAQSCEASLTIAERPLKAPRVVEDAIEKVASSWQRPDGEELVDPLTVARCLREVSCGFFYFWRWPRGEPKPVRDAWLEARKEWHKELRERLKKSGPHMDSMLLLTKAAIRWHSGFAWVDEQGRRHEEPPHSDPGLEHHPVWASEAWPRWRDLRTTAEPVTEAEWMSTFMLEDMLEWLKKPGLCWYEHDAIPRKLALYTPKSWVHCGPGEDGNHRVLGLTGQESALISIKAHGTGKNLQMFSRNLVANPPSGGAEWEQLLGRTHRQGQLADEVEVEVYRHTAPFRDALERARELSTYIQGSFGNTQKLVAKADWRF